MRNYRTQMMSVVWSIQYEGHFMLFYIKKPYFQKFIFYPIACAWQRELESSM